MDDDREVASQLLDEVDELGERICLFLVAASADDSEFLKRLRDRFRSPDWDWSQLLPLLMSCVGRTDDVVDNLLRTLKVPIPGLRWEALEELRQLAGESGLVGRRRWSLLLFLHRLRPILDKSVSSRILAIVRNLTRHLVDDQILGTLRLPSPFEIRRAGERYRFASFDGQVAKYRRIGDDPLACLEAFHRFPKMVPRLRKALDYPSFEIPAHRRMPVSSSTLRGPRHREEEVEEPGSRRRGKDAAPPAAPRVGERLLGRWRIRAVRSGAAGRVLIALDEEMEVQYAIKTPHDHILANPKLLKRFVGEAKIWLQLGIHENIVGAHTLRWDGTRPYLLLEFIPGHSLRAVLDQKTQFSMRKVLRLGRDIARGLAHIHTYGTLHRDVKPENVLIDDRTGRARITDFGLARPDTRLTKQGEMGGTPAYMPPEQFISLRDVDTRADVYATGAILYELLAGRPAFGPGSIYEIAVEKRYGTLAPLPRTVPSAVSELISACLSPQPEKRPEDGPALLALLENLKR